MKSAMRATLIVFRLLGLAQIVLGVVFWAGRRMDLVPLHMVIGMAFVLALWALAVLGFRAGASGGLVMLSVVWGLLVTVLGATQTRLLPGDGHWVVRVLHLLTALVAMGLAGRLAAPAGVGRRRERVRRPVVVGWPEGGGM
jgi:hypothetical protein